MKLILVGLAFGFWTGVAGGAELLVNGGFESGVDNDADGWSEGIIGGGTTLVREAGAGVGGSLAMYGSVDYVSGTGTKTELRQQTVSGSVIAGEAYTLSFQARGLMGPGGVAWYELFWIGDSGGVVGGSGLRNLFATLSEDYQEFGGVFTAPARAVAVVVSIRLEGGAFAGSSGELWVDAVSLTGESVVTPGGDGALSLAIRRDGGVVIFSWSGRTGKVYDLRGSETMEGDPMTWPVVYGDIEPRLPRNEESIGLLPGGAEFFVVVEREP